jgi:hypothetical protein
VVTGDSGAQPFVNEHSTHQVLTEGNTFKYKHGNKCIIDGRHTFPCEIPLGEAKEIYTSTTKSNILHLVQLKMSESLVRLNKNAAIPYQKK